MLIKDLIKEFKKEFGSIEFKATDLKTNKIYKSGGYDLEEKNIRQRRGINTKSLW
jgi:hypothetical protein